MTKLRINVPEVWIQQYDVEADSKTEAIEKIRKGECQAVETGIGFVYSHTLESYEQDWTIESNG